MNIPNFIIQTIKSLYAEAKTSVILNGLIGHKFCVTRGVRQGDPLSCLLFNVAIESLAEMLRKSQLKGLSFPEVQERILSCLFADDTTIFLSQEDTVRQLQEILTMWCKASGAKFNIEKTVIIPLGCAEQRERIHSTHKIGESQTDTIPEDIQISKDGEPV
jgi:hypothetical protein